MTSAIRKLTEQWRAGRLGYFPDVGCHILEVTTQAGAEAFKSVIGSVGEVKFVRQETATVFIGDEVSSVQRHAVWGYIPNFNGAHDGPWRPRTRGIAAANPGAICADNDYLCMLLSTLCPEYEQTGDPDLYIRTNGRLPARTDCPVLTIRPRGVAYGYHQLVAPTIREIANRIRLLLPPEQRVERGGLSLDLVTCAVETDGNAVHITPKEARLLSFLMGIECAASCSEIATLVWGTDDDSVTNTLQAHICTLRRKIGAQWIETVPREGYRFAGKL